MKETITACLAALLVLGMSAGVIVIGGCSSDPGAPEPPVPDTTPPAVAQATATRIHRIEVVFNEKVDPASAENSSNYVVLVSAVSSATRGDLSGKSPGEANMGAPGDTVSVQGASLEPGGKKVILTTDPIDEAAAYELFVSGVADLKGNVIDETVMATVASGIKSGKIYTIVGDGIPGIPPPHDEFVDPLESGLYLPQDMTRGPDGNLYIVDWNNHRIRVIENGLIHTIIGTGELGDANPGVGVEIGLNHPTNVSFDSAGNLYMAAWHNSKIMVYDLATGFCDVYVNRDGKRWWEGDGGEAIDAIINLPSSTMVGPDGNLYISDQANFCVRMVNLQTDVVSTVVAAGQCAGTACAPGFCGDGGPAVDACLDAPRGQSAAPASRLEFDNQGNLYLADTGNNRIRVVDTGGIINTIAGSGVAGFSGDGGDALAAQFNFPSDVAIAPNGNVYIADKENHCVRMIDGLGVITTVAGTGGARGFHGDGGDATKALLDEPFGIHVDAEGDLYIADTKNHRIRVVYR